MAEIVRVAKSRGWEELHRLLLGRLAEAEKIDWERASLDSAIITAKKGEAKRDRNAMEALLWSTGEASR